MVSFTFPITPSEKESLLKFGLIVESAAGMPDLPMTEVVSRLLDSSNNYNLTQILDIQNAQLQETLPSIPLRQVALSLLQSQVLETAPHDKKGTVDWKVLTVLTILALIAVILRLVSRRQSRTKLAAEEWLIAFSMCIIAAYTLTVGLGYGWHGCGNHIYDISFNTFKDNLLLVYAAELTYCFAIFFVRCSLLVFYYGLSHVHVFHVGIGIVFTFNLMLLLTRVFFNAFSCRPFNFWSHPIERVCVHNLSDILIACASLNVLVDCMVLLLPAPVVWKLPLSKKERFIVLGIFGVGTMAMVGSITRIFTLEPFLHTVDRTYWEVPLGVWSLVELNLGIIATCIPALRHLFKRWWPRVRKSSASTSSSKRRALNLFWGKGSGSHTTGSSSAATTTGRTITTPANTNTVTLHTSATIAGATHTGSRNVPLFGEGDDGREYGIPGGFRPSSASESQIGIATTTFDGESQFELDEYVGDRMSEKTKEDLEQGLGGNSVIVSPTTVRRGSDSGSAVASSGVGGEDELDSSEESLESGVLGQRHKREDSMTIS